MRRAIGVLILAVVLGLIAAACSGDDSDDSSSSTTNESVASSQPETEETTTQPETEETTTQAETEETTTTVFTVSDDELGALDQGCGGAERALEGGGSLDPAEIANPLLATFPADSDLAVFGQRLIDATTPEEQQQVLTELLAACRDDYGMVSFG